MSTNPTDQIKHLGIDAGGTFTDFLLMESDATLRTHKVLSTPDNPAKAIFQGIQELGLEQDLKTNRLNIIHGSTVATNATLERKTARTAYVTNKGFKDVLTIGRQNRKALYDLMPKVDAPPVPEDLCFELDCRRDAQGQLIKALDDQAIADLVQALKAKQVESVAINFLFSFLNDDEERRVEDALRQAFDVSRSSFVLPVYKEYERGIATWLNAALRPKVSSYLKALQSFSGDCSISMIQSSGGLLTLEEASQRPVNLLLSGPAGGLSAVKLLSETSQRSKILSFDMGGTSTDVSVLNGEFVLTDESRIADWPIAIPMLQIDTIGAGGGSIAWVDEAGMLHVGPESAGSSPGPACYGIGGERATVTDANVVLEKIPKQARLGGTLALNFEAAYEAVSRIAAQLSLSVIETANGIVALAEQQMVAALHNISVKQGLSPKDFTLCCFGGAGGMHVCSLAEQLEVSEAIVPLNAGVLSAFGMLAAPPQRSYTRSVIQALASANMRELDTIFGDMREQIRASSPELALNGIESRFADLRYLGQSYTIEVPFDSDCAEQFESAHSQRFGHRLKKPIELVNIRLTITGRAAIKDFPTAHQAPEHVKANHEGEANIYSREKLSAHTSITGPAIIVETTSTTWVKSGWKCSVDAFGNLLLKRA